LARNCRSSRLIARHATRAKGNDRNESERKQTGHVRGQSKSKGNETAGAQRFQRTAPAIIAPVPLGPHVVELFWASCLVRLRSGWCRFLIPTTPYGVAWSAGAFFSHHRRLHRRHRLGVAGVVTFYCGHAGCSVRHGFTGLGPTQSFRFVAMEKCRGINRGNPSHQTTFAVAGLSAIEISRRECETGGVVASGFSKGVGIPQAPSRSSNL
jgi:hypothetical protein